MSIRLAGARAAGYAGEVLRLAPSKASQASCATGTQGDMDVADALGSNSVHGVTRLTREWGEWQDVSLYLGRCQHDTPDSLVEATWRHVLELRPHVGTVVDFGAGDGRFARGGQYKAYVGYEIDDRRTVAGKWPSGAEMLHECAFTSRIDNADVCIGNPPFVRNQDLPGGWREHAASVLRQRTGVTISGLANAWQYFFLLALASVHTEGLCALVIPYEWVSRPSARALREYLIAQQWRVRVYRLIDTTFDSVLTTSSITIVDKAARDGVWEYYEETASGKYTQLASPSGGASGVLEYLRRPATPKRTPRAARGLSPGTQAVLTLTDGERIHFGLHARRDVVPCVTTLRHLPNDVAVLDTAAHRAYYRAPGHKCWLIRTDGSQSPALMAYLDGVPATMYDTSTCRARDVWWQYAMPTIPDALMSMSFKGAFPKAVKNAASVRAVGGVCGVYDLTDAQTDHLVRRLGGLDLRGRVVAHSNGLQKMETNQINALLHEAFAAAAAT